MARFTVKVSGGVAREITAGTVGEAKAQLGLQNYAAVVNGMTANDSTIMLDGQTLNLATQSKGG